MKPSAPSRDCVRGSELALPLINHIRTLHSHNATRITWHSHQYYELLCVLHGAAAYELSDKRLIKLTGGHFVIIPPGVVHRGAHDVRTPVTLLGIQFDPCRADALKNTTIIPRELALMRSQLKNAGLKARAYSSEMWRAIDQLLVEKDFRRQQPKTATFVWAIMRTLACKTILEGIRLLNAQEISQQEELILAAKQFLMQRLEQPFCLSDLVRHIGLSRTRLFTLFKAETGLTPNDFFVRCRIEQAQRLLIETGHPITQIAFDLGFSSSQYFSRAFWRYTDQTPRAFRQNSLTGRVF